MSGFYDRGKTISFRLPNDTPESVLSFLNELKEVEGRNFSRKLATILFEGILNKKEATEDIILTMPASLTKEEQEVLQNKITKRLLGHVIYQMITQDSPVKKENSELHERKEELLFETSAVHNRFAKSMFDFEEE
ncbi:hypothetical protein ABFG93_22300 (plasmid) [Pseudalkalibacillus hwajinpoensis]|uniref:hypothetical protein n=1 Tax=Guptibacillus hwajinpoensis TaxID=208199 RepID=UPI00325B78FD